MADALVAEAERRHARLLLGFADAVEPLVSELCATNSDTALAWGLLLSAQSRLVGGAAGPSQSMDRMTSLFRSGESVRKIACQAFWYAERAAVLGFDAAGLRAHLGHHETMSRGVSAPVIQLPLRLARCWLAWLEGHPGSDDAIEIGRAARQAQLGALVVEAQVLEALHHLATGGLDHATTSARRASRMARAEGIPDAEVLASITLARVRRLQDRPHLAVRILTGLAPHAPHIWREWMAWEAVLSGALSIRGLDPHSLAGRVAALTDATRQGKPEWAHVPADALIERTEHVAPLRADAQDAVSLLCPDRGANEAMAAWRCGATTELPPGVTGLAFAGAVELTDDTNCARVVFVPSGQAQRIAALSSPFIVALYEADASPAEGPTRPRTDSGLSALALAGGTMSVPDYFQHVYGYAFDPAAHNAVLCQWTGKVIAV